MNFRKIIIKMGRLKVVIFITTLSILLSCFINWLASSSAYHMRTPYQIKLSYQISIIIPLLVAPLCSWSLTGLLLRINQLEIQMRYIASVDQLTGLLSRHNFLELSTLAMNHTKQSKKDISLIMLDLDLFKSINDTYGHSGGDLVLSHFGSLLKSICRKGDLIGRIGGEEFCIFLIDCDSANAIIIAKKIILRLHKEFLEYNYKTITYTASLGISSYNIKDPDIKFEKLLNQADIALYTSKKSGRDKFSVY